MDSALLDPRLKNVALGSSEWFAAQRSMVKDKPLIRRCYDLWYRRLLADADSVPAPFASHPIVELGSGSSYIKELRPEIITSDVTPGLADMVIDGRELPFPDSSVRAIFLTHVFHHIPDVNRFFREACRVLVPGGVISMVDETHTPFARFFFGRVHPEPYDDKTPAWSFAEGHSMLDSNQALTWIVFDRDRQRFEREFPMLQLEQRCFMPWFSYLMSGGVNLRTFFPRFLTSAVRTADSILRPLDSLFAIHWHLTIRKVDGDSGALGKEARYLHRTFFRSDAPPEVVDRYVAANRLCCAEPSPLMDRIVADHLDAEAIELALRLRKVPTVLTKKIQILFYLLEVRSAYYSFFVGDEESRPRAMFSLVYSILQTAVKYLKGAYLVRKHGFV